MTTRTPQPALYLGTVTTGSGVDITSREGQIALARALLRAAPKPSNTSTSKVG